MKRAHINFVFITPKHPSPKYISNGPMIRQICIQFFYHTCAAIRVLLTVEWLPNPYSGLTQHTRSHNTESENRCKNQKSLCLLWCWCIDQIWSIRHRYHLKGYIYLNFPSQTIGKSCFNNVTKLYDIIVGTVNVSYPTTKTYTQRRHDIRYFVYLNVYAMIFHIIFHLELEGLNMCR